MYLIIYLIIHIICIPIVYYYWRYESKEDNNWTWKEFKMCLILSIFLPTLVLILALYAYLEDKIKTKYYIIKYKFPKEPPKWL